MKFDTNIDNWIHLRWAWHAGFVGIFIAVTLFGYMHNIKLTYEQEIQFIVTETSLNLSAVYLSAWILLPYLLYRKQFLIYAVAVIFLTTVFCYTDYFLNYSVLKDIVKIEQLEDFSASSFTGFYVFLILFGSSLKFAKDTVLKEYATQKTEKQRLIQEANFLRSQLSAHFLLNSMNNLYGLSVIKDERLPSLMLQLSELLQYSLYDTREAYVPLRGELDYLKNYIDLMKIRLSAKVNLNIEIAEVTDKNLNIAPMILATYVENAFKHIFENTNNQRFIHIKINTEGEKLFLHAQNTFCPTTIQHIENANNRKGVGLENTKRRLDLLYPNRYVLTVNEENGVYKVFLEILCSQLVIGDLFK